LIHATTAIVVHESAERQWIANIAESPAITSA